MKIRSTLGEKEEIESKSVRKLPLDYFRLSIEIVGIVALSIFGFYAVRLLASFRRGMLEKGWRMVTIGAVILVIGQIPFLLSGIANPSIMSSLFDTGSLLRFVGIVFLALGFRAQYEVWRIDNKNVHPTIPSGKSIEN